MADRPDEQPPISPVRALAIIDPNGVYTLQQLVELFRQISGSGTIWRVPRNIATLRKLMSTVREPGKIWARNIGGSGKGMFWMIPGLSILEFFRGDARSGCCATCGKAYNRFEILETDFTVEEIKEWLRQR